VTFRPFLLVVGLTVAAVPGCASDTGTPGCPKIADMAKVAAPFAADEPLFHVAFRRKLGAALPQAGTMVMIHSLASHYYTAEWSIIATRGDRGWTVSEVGEERPAMTQIKQRAIMPADRALSAETGARLDALLANPCLYSEPTVMMPVAGTRVGAEYQVVEIRSPSGHRSVQTVAPGMGLTGRILSLLVDGASPEP